MNYKNGLYLRPSNSSPAQSTIYVVATPIGNLEDISARALRILKSVSTIYCEDTRVTRKLLSHFNITGKNMLTYAEQDEQPAALQIIKSLIDTPQDIALVSDAGTPLISDPGYRLVKLAREHGIKCLTIPGPSSLSSFIAIAGLPSDRVLYVGFLPAKATQLRHELARWPRFEATIVCFETARRLRVTLKLISESLPTATVCIARELSKLYEETVLLDAGTAYQWALAHKTLKGEIVLGIHLSDQQGVTSAPVDLETRIKDEAILAFAQGKRLKDLLRDFRDCGLNRGQLYQLLLEAKKES